MKKILGIELGSTRIKSVLINESGNVICSGTFEWENDYENGHWTYSLQKIKAGLQASYADLVKNYGKDIMTLDAIGVSAMMHGYLAFDDGWNLLEPFRTWRDTTTAEASEILTEKLKFNFPQRWSATHFYQAKLNMEKSVSKVAHLTTLAGYVHYMLTGKNVLGADDASGMFPVVGNAYDEKLVKKYNTLVGTDIRKLLPRIMLAGGNAGTLTKSGAEYLDPTGKLCAGAVLCPPEGDAGTGMVATNCIAARTANISAGTSAFLMAVLEKPLSSYYKEIDIVATPTGLPVAMLHLNNCTNEINEWVGVFSEVAELVGAKVDKNELFVKLFNKSTESDREVGKLVGYNFLGGEPIGGTTVGAPMTIRECDGKLNLTNFMQMQLYSAIAALSLGMDILKKENVEINSVTAHGGFYKTDAVGQAVTSAVIGAPVTVMKNSGEGGAYGIALLALYALDNRKPLEEFLDGIFGTGDSVTLVASDEQKAQCDAFLTRYKKFLKIERLASEAI